MCSFKSAKRPGEVSAYLSGSSGRQSKELPSPDAQGRKKGVQSIHCSRHGYGKYWFL